jgi:hypothetical protein
MGRALCKTKYRLACGRCISLTKTVCARILTVKFDDLNQEAMENYIGLFTCSFLYEEISKEKDCPFFERIPAKLLTAESSNGFIWRGKGNDVLSESGQLTSIEYGHAPFFYEDLT